MKAGDKATGDDKNRRQDRNDRQTVRKFRKEKAGRAGVGWQQPLPPPDLP